MFIVASKTLSSISIASFYEYCCFRKSVEKFHGFVGSQYIAQGGLHASFHS
jgi:hypothetical protein